jgi:methionine aminopeptidase
MDISKVDIGTHYGVERYDGQRLDKVYAYDVDMVKVPQNPKLLMIEKFKTEVKNIKIENIRPKNTLLEVEVKKY